MIVGQAPREGERPLFEMCKTASVIIPETIDMMSWSDEGARSQQPEARSGQERRDARVKRDGTLNAAGV
jgi:hypothetical protein